VVAVSLASSSCHLALAFQFAVGLICHKKRHAGLAPACLC